MATDVDSYGDEGAGPQKPTPSPIDWGLLALHSAFRRWWIIAVMFVLGVVGAFMFFQTRTPLYRSETRMLAQRQLALPSIVNRTIIDEEPTRGAWELVHRRDNILNLIKQANVPVPAPSKPKLVNRLLGLSAEPVEEQDPLNDLAVLISKNLRVMAEQNTVTISLDWADPEVAHRVVQAAQQNFLEARHIQEITALGEVIALLQTRSNALREQLDAATEEVYREFAQPTTTASGRPSRTVLASEEAVKLRSDIESTERAITDLEGLRRRDLETMQSRLEQMRTIYSDNFPAVIAMRRDIANLQTDSPQLATLRAELRQMERKFKEMEQEARRQRGEGAAPSPRPSEGAAPRPLRNLTPEQQLSAMENDTRIVEARARYQQMIERVTAAQVDFDTASAAFKHRYKVVWPAEIAKEPVSPNPLKIFGAGIVLALGLGFVLAAAPDILRGKLLQKWQMEKGLGVPVLATLPRGMGTVPAAPPAAAPTAASSRPGGVPGASAQPAMSAQPSMARQPTIRS